ncbi:MAG: hypothetical protein AAFY15_07540 [Cyanobacteria bacterium J06648_11]
MPVTLARSWLMVPGRDPLDTVAQPPQLDAAIAASEIDEPPQKSLTKP